MKTRITMVLFALLVVFAACGETEPSATSPASTSTMAEGMDDMEDMEDDEHDEEFAFGEPAEADAATRVVEITAHDDFTFDPANATVAAGETVTFRVTNAGAIPHDFTLGDSHMQDEHEAEMAEMGGTMMHDEPNVFTLEPGETKEMTWHLTTPGELIYGCHQIGHYDAGMFGSLTVEG